MRQVLFPGEAAICQAAVIIFDSVSRVLNDAVITENQGNGGFSILIPGVGKGRPVPESMDFTESKALQTCKRVAGKHAAIYSAAHIRIIIDPCGTIAQCGLFTEMIIYFSCNSGLMEICVLHKAIAFIGIITA